MNQATKKENKMKTMNFSILTLILLIATTFTGCISEEDTHSAPNLGESDSDLLQAPVIQHCITTAVAQPKGESPSTTVDVPPTFQCFETFQEAMFAATNGRVRLPPSASPKTVDNQILKGDGVVTPNAIFVVGIEFEHANYQGATLTITSSVTCSGFTLSISSMPGGWNDVISSAKAFSNCNNSFHYEHVNFAGAVVNCGTACGYIGDAMNDRTSSIRWTN